MSKSKAVDADVEYFYYDVDLQIDPPLPDSKIKSASSDHFKVTQFKDEDVQMVNGEIAVVTHEVTKVAPKHSVSDHLYGYTTLKAGLGAIAKVAKDSGSHLNGQVIVKDDATNKIFRLKVVDNTVTVEEAMLGWPDGTKSINPWRDA